ncbi:MAG: SpoIIE family protein phosphatase [Oscillospiraceae bacterium]|nr:SpoIIE family protein phosphatase [Oscillospiraceae bacterium]
MEGKISRPESKSGASKQKRNEPDIKNTVSAFLSGFDRGMSVFAGDIYADIRQSESHVKNAFRTLFFCVALFAGALLISACPFLGEQYPIGLAIICAVGVRHRREAIGIRGNAMGAVLIAAALFSCIFMKSGILVSFFISTAVFLTRLAFTKGALNEGYGARVAIAASGAISRALITYIFTGFEAADIGYAALSGLSAAAFTFLLCGFHPRENAENLPDRSLHRTAAIGAVIFTAVLSIRGVDFLGFRISFVIGVVLTLCAAGYKNAFMGALCGIVCGTAVGMSGSAYIAPMLAAAGFCAGFLFPVAKIGSLVCSFAAGCAFCIFTGGSKALLSCGADFLAGILIFFFIMRFIPIPERAATQKIREITTGSSSDTLSEGKLRERIKGISDAFGSLSAEFTSISDRLRVPQITHATHIVSTTTSGLCSGCSLSGVCWGKEYTSTQDVALKLANKLSNTGSVSEDDMPAFFREKCIKSPELIATINKKYDKLCGEWLKNDRAQLLAGEYSTVSRLLKSAADDCESDCSRNFGAEKLARAALNGLGVYYKAIFAYGTRSLIVDCAGIIPSNLSSSSSEITASFEKKLGGIFGEPEFISNGTASVMRMRRKRRMMLECAKVSRAKNGEAINGDTASFFENPNDYFYTCVCDGMGTGRDAALTSRLAAIFIEKLLTSSGEKSITLEMLNGFLLAKNDECFTTVDLLEIDMLSGEASFIKAGAAPSYVLRAGRLYKINSATPPAGIIKRMTAELTKLELYPGDIAVLMSDGIEDGDMYKLPELLSGASPDISPAELSRLILDSACSSTGRGDDMTVAVVKARAA